MSTIIVGGGISGLAAAYYLAKAGRPFTLLEKSARLGGVIQTNRIEGCVLEGGPDSFLAAKPAAMELIRDCGLAADVIGSNDSKRVTYIWKGGRLIPMPDGLMMMVPTKILPMAVSPLMSWPTKIRMGLEFFRRPNGHDADDISVADFIRKHYGEEAVNYLVEPLLAGVFGGDPEQLSAPSVLTRFVELASKHGSLTKGVLASKPPKPPQPKPGQPAPTLFRTLKGGLGQLVDAMEQKVRANVRQGIAEAVERNGCGWRVRAGGDWLEAENLILACPAYQAGSLIAQADPELAAQLGAIGYNSSVTLSLGYHRATFDGRHEGFGFLVPKCEGGAMKACTFVHNKFDHRVPADKVVLRCFFSGDYLNHSDEALLQAAREDLRKMMGIQAEPYFHHIARWHRSMAQYIVGHRDRLKLIAARLNANPGLHLAGNGYNGIGIPDCIQMGKDAAGKIAAT